MRKKIRGQIIRILNNSSVVVNLGKFNGITEKSMFNILGSPEKVIDPISSEELGMINVVKGRIKAEAVYEKFTIATSKWSDKYFSYEKFFNMRIPGGEEVLDKQEEMLRVRPEEVKPWKATSQEYVKVGDEVEVIVELPDPPKKKETDQIVKKNQKKKDSLKPPP